MKAVFASIIVSLAFLPACSKKEPAPPEAATAPAPAENAPAQPAAEPAPSPAPQRSAQKARQPAAPLTQESAALVGMVHGFMTQQLRIFVKERGRMPEDFREFANARMDSVPRPPPGLHYDIDRTTMEVKLVRD